MEASVREVTVHRTTNLEDYRALESLDLKIAPLLELSRRVASALGPNRVWMLSSTESGGGVAEMMPRLCSLMNDLGVDTRWLVLEPGDPDFFRLTKSLHNMVHGESAAAPLDGARGLYERVSAAAAEGLRRHLTSSDLLIVHDPQPLGAAAMLRPEYRPRLVWRCHIGVPFQNSNTTAAWSFLRPYLEPFSRLLFSALPYIPEEHLARSGVLHPSIDPLSHKNRALRPYKLVGILRCAGLVDGPPAPSWACFDREALRFKGGRWVSEPIANLLHRPVVLQVSRFDRLKGFQHLIPAFARLLSLYPERVPHLRVDTDRARSELERVVLLLAGPDPAGVTDDPEGWEVLDELCRQHQALPAEVADRVHLVRLPMSNLKQNALTVNALQRMAAAVVQNSLQEGFGLTVSEALWKGTPVIASNVGGLCVQIRHGTDGLLVDEPQNPESIAEALLELLAYPAKAEVLAHSGRMRVRDHFLVLEQIRRWMEEILLQLERPARVSGDGAAAEALPA